MWKKIQFFTVSNGSATKMSMIHVPNKFTEYAQGSFVCNPAERQMNKWASCYKRFGLDPSQSDSLCRQTASYYHTMLKNKTAWKYNQAFLGPFTSLVYDTVHLQPTKNFSHFRAVDSSKMFLSRNIQLWLWSKSEDPKFWIQDGGVQQRHTNGFSYITKLWWKLPFGCHPKNCITTSDWLGRRLPVERSNRTR